MGRPIRNASPILPDYSEGIQIKTDDSDPRFISALARGLAILRCFELDQKLLGNVEIAEMTKLPKSTISRLTFTLTQLGYLRYRHEFGKYELAAGVVGLAYPYLANMNVPALARPLMVELAQKTKTNIGFGVQENNSALYLEYALGEPSPNRRQRVGFRVPLVRTAMGRACIAAMNFEERARLYSEFKSYYGTKWKDIHQELDSAIEQVEANGYCYAIGTFKKNTNAVAVPFLHIDNHTIMAFNSQSSDAKQPLSVLKKNGQLLLDMVDKVRSLLIENHTRPKIGRV